MFRPLAFVSVRQKKREPAVTIPLRLRGRQELIEYHLRTVGEIAELRFPDHEHLRIAERIAVLKSDAGRFRERTVVNAKPRLVRLEMIERVIALTRGLIEQHGVAVAERPALDILAGEAHRVAVQQQCAVREQLAHRPIQGLVLFDRLATILQQLLQFAMRSEVIGHRTERVRDSLKLFARRSGFHRVG